MFGQSQQCDIEILLKILQLIIPNSPAKTKYQKNTPKTNFEPFENAPF